MDETKVDRYLNTFANVNTATSHMKTEVIAPNQQNELLSFVIDSMMFLQKLNEVYRLILTSCLYNKDKKYYFSFHKFQDHMSLFEIAVDQNDAKRLVQRMYSMDEIKVDLSNVEFIETFYNIEYRKFMAVLARLLKVVEEAEYAKAGVRLSILKDNSPCFSLNISQRKNV